MKTIKNNRKCLIPLSTYGIFLSKDLKVKADHQIRQRIYNCIKSADEKNTLFLIVKYSVVSIKRTGSLNYF